MTHPAPAFLMTLDQLEQLLISPCCQSSLQHVQDKYDCASCGHSYDTGGRWSVLVDFAESVLNEEHVRAASGGVAVPDQSRHARSSTSTEEQGEVYATTAD